MGDRDTSEFTILVTEHESMPVISLLGEVDLHAVPNFRSAMQEAEFKVNGERPTMLVDLGEVEFMDSSGLGVLIGYHRQLKERGGGLRVVTGEAALKILRLTNLDTVLEIYDSRERALSGPAESSS